MTTTALVAYAGYLVLAVGVRGWLQWRRTGSTGFRGIAGRPGSIEWLAGVAFVAAIAICVAAPLLAADDVVEPIEPLDRAPVHAAGIALFLAGLVATLAAQLAMGASWRIGVDESERTELVTEGPFAVVRNPIFAAFLPTFLGIALMVPSWVAFAGIAALFAALELQVRVVEEPYLLRSHGDRYADYAARVGRFLPRVGRLRG